MAETVTDDVMPQVAASAGAGHAGRAYEHHRFLLFNPIHHHS
ncbi:hypothetical protein M2271_000413 [Streptomyces sp. LBL]|nr:hypothetical protein [Streptomyces sp. LBL]